MDINLKFFKKEKKFKKESSWFSLALYWRLVVFLVFLSAIFSMFFGYYFFNKEGRESASGSSALGGQVEKIKKERIEKVLEYFAVKKQKSNQIINSPAPVVDPSL